MAQLLRTDAPYKMAAGHLKVSSSNTSNKSAIFADFYERNKHQDR
jgi:hypothetical protein